MCKYLRVGIFVMLIPAVLFADAIRAGFDANTFAGNDDGSILVNTGLDFNFYGIDGPEVYLNNNGNITFQSALYDYTPWAITGGSEPMIAPFFADVDTRFFGSEVTYGSGSVEGRDAYGFNWVDVDHYFSQDGPLNSFQLVMIDRSDRAEGDFDFEFNYDQIVWESGTASGGDTDGLGGFSAHVGFTNGAGEYWEYAGSGINGALLDQASTGLVNNRINSDVSGRYVFSVENGTIVPPPPPVPTPEPAMLSLVSLGLVFMVGSSMRKKK